MRGRFNRFERVDFAVLVLLSIAFFGLVAWAFVREQGAEWRPFQRRFAALLEEQGQIKAARTFRVGIRQLWVPELRGVDRCVTCHLGYEWAGVLPSDLPEPFTPHPNLPYLRKHPFEVFGCTSCHGGQGFATAIDAAHGLISHWEEPLLGKSLAAQYGLKRAELMEMRCNGCHRRENSTPGMERINRAKALVAKSKCVACHTIQGHGGTTGPELTYVGDKNPEMFDFSHVPGPRTALNWHIQHLLDPDVVSPGTQMPPYGFSEEDAHSLALLLLSWKKLPLPPRYIPGPRPLVAEKVVRERPVPPVVVGGEAGREVFLKHGCHSCHGVGVGTVVGPDLQGVGERRASAWLREWLANPAAMLRAHTELSDWPKEFGDIIMPNQNLSSADIKALVTYLEKL